MAPLRRQACLAELQVPGSGWSQGPLSQVIQGVAPKVPPVSEWLQTKHESSLGTKDRYADVGTDSSAPSCASTLMVQSRWTKPVSAQSCKGMLPASTLALPLCLSRCKERPLGWGVGSPSCH